MSEKITISLEEIEKQREDLKVIYYDVKRALQNIEKVFVSMDDTDIKGKLNDNMQNFVSIIVSDTIKPAYDYNIKTVAILNAVTETYKTEAVQTL